MSSPSVCSPRSVTVLCALLLPMGCTAPELCVGDCDNATDASSDDLRSCLVPTTIDLSRCGDGIEQPGELCFDAPVVIPLEGDPYSAIAGDFDDDGTTDVLWATETGQVRLRRGVIGSPLSASSQWAPASATRAPVLLTGATDLDADGALDAITRGESGVDLLRGDGAGTRLDTRTLYSSATVAWGPALVDDDADGDPDLALLVVGAPVNRLTLVNDGLGNMVATPRFDETGPHTLPTTVADLDGLGPADYISTIEDTLRIRTQGNGPVGDTTLSLARAHLNARYIHVADANGDDTADLILGVLDTETRAPYGETTVVLFQSMAVHLGTGPGPNGAPTFDAGTYRDMDCSMTDFRLVDVDGDGALDAVGSHSAIHDQSASLLVRKGDGAGNFDAVLRVAAPADIETGGELLVGDFDGDGRQDIVTVQRRRNALVLYRGGL